MRLPCFVAKHPSHFLSISQFPHMIRPLLALALFFIPAASHAQLGQYVNFWGGSQLVRLTNSDDFYSTQSADFINSRDLYRSAFGIDYIKNYQVGFGYGVGLAYSRQGSAYGGTLQYVTPAGEARWNSQIFLDYLKVPFTFRFNSVTDNQDVVSLTIYAGLQPEVLLKAYNVGYTRDTLKGTLLPDTAFAKYSDFDYTDLYKRLQISFVGGGQLNFKISRLITTAIGIRYDRSVFNIEKNDYAFPSDFPAAGKFPVSVPKSINPAKADILNRSPTLNNTIGLYLTLQFRLADVEEPEPRDRGQ